MCSYVTIFGHFKGKSQKFFCLEGFGREKHKYLKSQPDIAQLKRVLLCFYVTIFGHFKGKKAIFFFFLLFREELKVELVKSSEKQAFSKPQTHLHLWH